MYRYWEIWNILYLDWCMYSCTIFMEVSLKWFLDMMMLCVCCLSTHTHTHACARALTHTETHYLYIYLSHTHSISLCIYLYIDLSICSHIHMTTLKASTFKSSNNIIKSTHWLTMFINLWVIEFSNTKAIWT